MIKKTCLILIILGIVALTGCVQKEVQETTIESEETRTEEAEILEPIVEETEIVEEPTTIDPNLVAHWKFDDDAEDSAGDNHGSVKGDAVFTTGKFNNALSFDGVDDYVDLPQETTNQLKDLSQGTIAFWFKFDSLLDKQTIMPIFYIGMDNERDEDNIFIIEIGHFDERTPQALAPNNKKLYVTWIKDNQDPFLCYDSRTNLEENKWHHFAVVVSPKGNTGYLNGVEMTNKHYNFGRSSDDYFLDDIPNLEKVMLGQGRSSYMVGPDFVYYKGALDDFRIYNRALSASEILELI